MGASNAGFLLALPFLLLWLLVARLLSMLSPIVAPWLSYVLAQRLYYATPFALYALRAGGGAKALMTRVGFEASYCMNGARLGPVRVGQDRGRQCPASGRPGRCDRCPPTP